MKRLLIPILVLALAILITNCSPQDLPPEPGAPGAIGHATEPFEGYAIGDNALFLNKDLFTVAHGDLFELSVSVEGDDLFFGTGYILVNNEWQAFEYAGDRVGNTSWIRGNAEYVSSFGFEQIPPGTSWILAYGCSREQGVWECHSQQWLIKEFAVEEELQLNLEIISSKTTYQMGEPVSGSYVVNYPGEPFDGIALYTQTRDGFDKKIQGKLGGPVNLLGGMQFTAFKIDESGFVSSTDYFFNEGTYHYSISIYSCENIISQLGQDCSINIDTDDLTILTPLKTTTKTIIVQGGTNPSECTSNIDCTTTCVGCDEGKQICEQTDEKCIDCFLDSQCKESYTCRDNTCVLRECNQDADCPFGCENGLCVPSPEGPEGPGAPIAPPPVVVPETLTAEDLDVSVGGSTDLTGVSGTQQVDVTHNNEELISFDHNFAQPLSTDNIVIQTEQTGSTAGFTLVQGVTGEKTVRLKKLLGDQGICIKDAPVASVTEMTEECDGTDEIPLECPGEFMGYICTDAGTHWEVSGVQYTFIYQFLLNQAKNKALKELTGIAINERVDEILQNQETGVYAPTLFDSYVYTTDQFAERVAERDNRPGHLVLIDARTLLAAALGDPRHDTYFDTNIDPLLRLYCEDDTDCGDVGCVDDFCDVDYDFFGCEFLEVIGACGGYPYPGATAEEFQGRMAYLQSRGIPGCGGADVNGDGVVNAMDNGAYIQIVNMQGGC